VAETCVFCGGSPLTREHVWPDWIRRLIYGKGKRGPRSEQLREGSRPGEERKVWHMPALSLQAKIVCEECNQGWMSELEVQTSPVLTPMILGNRVRLDAAAQRLLARWITKTAMVFLRATPRPSAIPPNQYRYLRDHRRPPPSSQAWIGIRTAEEGVAAGKVAAYSFRDRPRGGEELGRAYLVTLGIGHLVGALFGHNLAFEIPWQRPPAFQPVWPVVRRIVEWPPQDLIGPLDDLDDDAGFREYVEDALLERRGLIVQRNLF
jgi:hypothetical protein